MLFTTSYAVTPNYTYMDEQLKVFLPDSAKNLGVMILCCPGGGYTHLATMHEGYDFAPWLNKEGISLAVLSYSMPNGDKDLPLADVHKAFEILNAHKAEWGIRTTGIMGFSAGGHLASTAATKFTSDVNRPDFQILFYPVINMDNYYAHRGSQESLLGTNASDKLKALYSNEKQVKSDTPPAFILLSDDDETISPLNSTLYYNALKAKQISAEMYIFPEGGHGWGYKDTFRYKRFWQPLLLNWLQKR